METYTAILTQARLKVVQYRLRFNLVVTCGVEDTTSGSVSFPGARRVGGGALGQVSTEGVKRLHAIFCQKLRSL